MGEEQLELIIFMQGDDATEAFRILEPDYDDLIVGRETQETLNATMDHLAQWDYGEPGEVHPYERSGGAYEYRRGEHVMQWHTGLGWIALYRKVSQER